MQLEDGPSVEYQVKCATPEPDLKLIMWERLGRPAGPLYLHVMDANGAVMLEFKIAAGWKYALRRQPLSPLKNHTQPRRVDDEDKDQKSAARRMREARIIAEKSGASGAAAQEEKNEKKGTKARTADSGTGRTSRMTVGLSPRLG
jgi:hypothetical protein